MIGYTDAMNQERSRRRAARERRERKKYFAMQKLNGVALLIFTAVAIKILEGDATIAFITVPLGLAVLVMGLNISTIIEIYVLYLPG